MKMVMISYNEAIDFEVMEVLAKSGIGNYTKIKAAYGKGNASGTHLGNDIWPGRNNILYAACEDYQAKELIIQVKEIRKSLKKEGIKAFILPIEEVT